MKLEAKQNQNKVRIFFLLAAILSSLFLASTLTPSPELAQAAGPTLSSTFTYTRDLDPQRELPFCEGVPYSELDCSPGDRSEIEILQHGPRVEAWTITMTTSLVGAAAGWGFCSADTELYLNALRNFNVLNENGIAPGYSYYNFTDFLGKGLFIERARDAYSNTTNATVNYSGLVFPGNKSTLAFTPKFLICGPKTPGSPIMTWQWLTGKSTKLPALNRWPTIG